MTQRQFIRELHVWVESVVDRAIAEVRAKFADARPRATSERHGTSAAAPRGGYRQGRRSSTGPSHAERRAQRSMTRPAPAGRSATLDTYSRAGRTGSRDDISGPSADPRKGMAGSAPGAEGLSASSVTAAFRSSTTHRPKPNVTVSAKSAAPAWSGASSLAAGVSATASAPRMTGGAPAASLSPEGLAVTLGASSAIAPKSDSGACRNERCTRVELHREGPLCRLNGGAHRGRPGRPPKHADATTNALT